MSGEFNIKVGGAKELEAALLAIVPEMRKGPAQRALRKGAEPVLAAAIRATPALKADIYVRGKLYRKAGLLRSALRIRSSKDTNKTGDVGVFVNIKPLNKGAIADFKAATGRRSSTNPADPYFWRFVHFATRRNKNPRPFLTIAGNLLTGTALPIITSALKQYIENLNKRIARK